MTFYTRLWLVGCVPLAAVGASLAFVKSPVAATFLFIYFGAFGMLLTLGLVAGYWEASSGGRMRLLACGAVVGGGVGCSIIGLAPVLGFGVLLLAVLVLAGSPYAVRRWHRWLGVAGRSGCLRTLARGCARARPHYASRPQLDLGTLTDEQLCQLWRASYLALLNPSTRPVGVAERQRYLDEFERRNRSGFATWLASGPLASANPLPYLIGVPTINWDDLTREQD